MSGDVHVRFCESLRVRLLRATHLLLGFKGPKAEAQEIKERIGAFLKESLRLELSEDKTLITHATNEAARFLGYEITTQFSQHTRKANGIIALRVPADVVDAKCSRYMKKGKPVHRNELIWCSDYEIVLRYQREFRGCVQYYILCAKSELAFFTNWGTYVFFAVMWCCRDKSFGMKLCLILAFT